MILPKFVDGLNWEGYGVGVGEKTANRGMPKPTTARFRALADLSTDVMFIKDVDGRYLLANKAAHDTIGLKPGEIVGKTDFELFSREIARELRQIDLDVMATRSTHTYDRSPQIENHERVIQIQKVPYLNPNGGILGVIGIGRDVTKARKEEKDLREIQDRLKAVVELADDLIYIKSVNGTYLLMNPSAVRNWRLYATDPVGKTDVEVFGEERSKVFREHDRAVMETGESRTFEWTGKFSGKEMVFQTTKVPYRSSSGEIIGVIGISRVVTELRRLEREARHAMEVESGVGKIRDVARELQTLLQSIQEDGDGAKPVSLGKATELARKLVDLSAPESA